MLEQNSAVLFVASLADYDQKSPKGELSSDAKATKMDDSLDLFELVGCPAAGAQPCPACEPSPGVAPSAGLPCAQPSQPSPRAPHASPHPASRRRHTPAGLLDARDSLPLDAGTGHRPTAHVLGRSPPSTPLRSVQKNFRSFIPLRSVPRRSPTALWQRQLR